MKSVIIALVARGFCVDANASIVDSDGAVWDIKGRDYRKNNAFVCICERMNADPKVFRKDNLTLYLSRFSLLRIAVLQDMQIFFFNIIIFHTKSDVSGVIIILGKIYTSQNWRRKNATLRPVLRRSSGELVNCRVQFIGSNDGGHLKQFMEGKTRTITRIECGRAVMVTTRCR